MRLNTASNRLPRKYFPAFKSSCCFYDYRLFNPQQYLIKIDSLNLELLGVNGSDVGGIYTDLLLPPYKLPEENKNRQI